ncbi:MAG: sugar transferase [Armatimonadetes bacterium]|nr:sugar transferase [Armatimonadota bacterium]
MVSPIILTEDVIERMKSNPAVRARPVYDALTRVIDVLAAACGLLCFWPLMFIVAAAIKLTSRGPVFFRQERLGRRGVNLRIIKFRTMAENAEFSGEKLRVAANDTRITPVGKVLREFHLDELPQLFNVLLGQMSLVGPRPAIPFHKDYYQAWEMPRILVRPGMTGLAQVSGGNALSWDERIAIDVYYVRNRNLAMYARILFLTFAQLFIKKGVYTADGSVKGWTRPLPDWYEKR